MATPFVSLAAPCLRRALEYPVETLVAKDHPREVTPKQPGKNFPAHFVSWTAVVKQVEG